MALASLKGEDLTVPRDFPADKALGVGARDVKHYCTETREETARTILRVAAFIDPERLWANPDCRLNQDLREVAFAKLRTMIASSQLAEEQLAHS
jgi:methionine synthase II (cobalamin-independent)